MLPSKNVQERFLIPLYGKGVVEVCSNLVTIGDAKDEEGLDHPLNRWNIAVAVIKKQRNGNLSGRKLLLVQELREVTAQINWNEIKRVEEEEKQVPWGTCPECGLYDPTGIGQGAKCPNCS